LCTPLSAKLASMWTKKKKHKIEKRKEKWVLGVHVRFWQGSFGGRKCLGCRGQYHGEELVEGPKKNI